ncbi:peptidylprolyl isomerase [Haliangium sp.]|uniref:peptidylprolyl isomerase n=1 Tax=Haliangium sp. TaxID=2663208 RepID=UPI003D1121C8
MQNVHTRRYGELVGSLVAVVAVVAISGCASQTAGPGAASTMTDGAGETANAPERNDAPSSPATTAPEPAPQERGRAVIHTTEGPITVTFFPAVAPQTVAHIGQLMAAGCYQGVSIFRLEPGFVLQVAPVANRECHPAAMSTIPGEFSSVPHRRLYLSMARWDDPDSGTSSWSIMLGPAPSMDGQYTVFGRVVDGEDVIRKLEAIGSTKGDDGMSRLNRSVSIERVEISEPVGEPVGEPGTDPTSE